MSSPRKEQWLGRFGESLGVPLAMAVGGAIDIDDIPRRSAAMRELVRHSEDIGLYDGEQ
jgi:hypothetical protein